MKACCLFLPLLVLAATPAVADLSPNPIGVSLARGIYLFEDVAVPVILRTRTGFYPPFRLGNTRVVDRTIEIEVLLPEATTVVEPYDAVLMTRVVPDQPGLWQIKLITRLGEASEVNAAASFTVYGDSVQLEYTGPPQPTENDEIVVELDRKPPTRPQVLLADGRVRLASQTATGWQPAPEGYEVSLGKLPPGDYKLELFTYSEGIHDQLELTVLPAPEEPGPIVLAGDFTVAVTWENAAGEMGEAKLVQPPSRDSALLYFFSPDNWELMVKVLDGCAINGHYWVFGAASTDVGYSIEITRTSTLETFHAENRVGVAAPAITNITAFPCDPGLGNGG